MSSRRRGCGRCGKAEAFFVEAFPSNSWKSSRRSRRRRPLSISTVAPIFHSPFAPTAGFRLAEEEPDIRNGKNPSKIRDRIQTSTGRTNRGRADHPPAGRARASTVAKPHRVLARAIPPQNALVDRPSKRERELEAENEKLKSKIGDLIMQMDHIKKLQTWVQRKKSADTSVITAKNWDQFRKPAK
jgi:hypothetical protein